MTNTNLTHIKEKLKSTEYDFLRTQPNLGNQIILLTLGGSHAYGTATEHSDIDLRGCALNSKREILVGKDFQQFVHQNTDTSIYSFNKLISLLTNANPNTMELLGNTKEYYLYLSPIGAKLLENRHLFLSRRVIHSFGGYAAAQLRRLDNKSSRLSDQSRREQHILNSVKNAFFTFPGRYFSFPEDAISLYIDKSVQEEYDTEIYMDIHLHHYPLRDYNCMWAEMQNIVKEYAKIGKRNKNAIEHNKLGKHMMHLIRLYMMCIDILEKEEIITYRKEEHDLLMSIRLGEYLDDNRQPTAQFYEILDTYEKRLAYAEQNTSLPEEPDYNAILDFTASVNEYIVKETI